VIESEKATEPHAHVAPSTSSDQLGAFVPGAAARVAGRSGGALSGRSFAAKDLFDVAGTRTGAGNPDFLEDAPVAEHHAPAVAALLDAGAALVGKTITDELAFSLSGTNVHYGTPKNSAAPGHVPGGSSSGSASAVAGGVVDLALGTDTGGSVRVPASYCGILGLRPTHGRVRLDGVVPLAPGFDTVGLFAREPEVLAAGWNALVEGASDVQSGVDHSVSTRTIRTLVCPPELLALLEPDARLELEPAADALGRLLGCRVVERSLMPPEELTRIRGVFRGAQMAQAWASHGAWIERRRPRFGPGIASRFEAASHVDPAAAEQLIPEREALRNLLATALGDDELLLQGSASGPAAPIALGGEAKDELRLQTLTLTALAGTAGVPVISLPLANVGGLPLGLSLVGLPDEEDLLTALGCRALHRD